MVPLLDFLALNNDRMPPQKKEIERMIQLHYKDYEEKEDTVKAAIRSKIQ